MCKKLLEKYKRLQDNDLLHQYSIEGDAYAFLALYNRYEAKLRIFFAKKVQNKQDREDLIQLTYEKLLTSEQVLNNQIKEFRPYLIGIARNVCCDYYKKKKHRNKQFGTLPRQEITQTNAFLQQEEYQEKELKIAAVNYAIDTTLTEEQRKVVRLELEGFSISEIAEKRNKKYSAITSLKNRAINTLRNSILNT